MTDRAQPNHAKPSIRLVVSDLDGTLLDGDSRVPVDFWGLLEQLRARDILFVPASGRPYHTLRHLFDGHADGMPFIAENGTYVVCDEREIASTPLEREVVREVVAALDGHAADQRRARGDRPAAVHPRLGISELGIVLCAKDHAFVRRRDNELVARGGGFFHSFVLVDDFDEVDAEILKIGVVDPAGAQQNAAPVLARFSDRCRAVISASFALDVFALGASKGTAVSLLQERYGIAAAETVVFGDYHNDLEMLDRADWSFAMANAHADVRRRARYQAPANTDGGVLTVLKDLLAGPDVPATRILAGRAGRFTAAPDAPANLWLR